ncbi:unnamed protein product [Peronospora belbahrii]|uniref:Uncharacterized protein n=1 Tax=Peronospora belbahrii TaxID=622444 RepID=A0ABN8D125_9STRA|nr:unnamed protein product [Peronospora belbahrii]
MLRIGRCDVELYFPIELAMSNMARPNEALIQLASALTHAISAGSDSNVKLYKNFSRKLNLLDIDDGSSSDKNVVPFEPQSDQEDMTMQPSITDSSDITIFIIVIIAGLVIPLGLMFLMLVFRRSKNDAILSECDANPPPDNSRFCMKRTTFAVPEASHSRLEETNSSESVVPVLGETNKNECTLLEGHPQEMKPLWTEASAVSSSYSIVSPSNRQSRLGPPTLVDAPARGRGLNDSQAESDNSSHTDDYSIDVLESPVSSEYSYSSEGDDVFPSTFWDVDSYRSMDCTFLSTTSADVFGSNRGRDSKAWNQVYGYSDTPCISLRQKPLSSGIFFARNIDPAVMRRMRPDTHAYGTRADKRMRLDIEV